MGAVERARELESNMRLFREEQRQVLRADALRKAENAGRTVIADVCTAMALSNALAAVAIRDPQEAGKAMADSLHWQMRGVLAHDAAREGE